MELIWLERVADVLAHIQPLSFIHKSIQFKWHPTVSYGILIN
jgi:hypothetical protein